MATTTISITIPTTELERIESGLCASAGIPTSAANAKRVVRQFIELTVLRQNEQEAEGAVRSAAAEAAQQIKPIEGLE